MYDKFEFEVEGVEFTCEVDVDNDLRYPWEEFDGYGVITMAYTWSSLKGIDKKPGQVILHHGERGCYTYLYDVQASQKKALKEGWGYVGGDDEFGITKRQRAAEAVKRDIEECRKWLRGDKFWVTIRVYPTEQGDEAAEDLGGLEWDDYDTTYVKECAEDLAEVIAKRVKKEAAEAEYWASRDTVTK